MKQTKDLKELEGKIEAKNVQLEKAKATLDLIPAHQRWPARTSQNHKVPQHFPSALSDSSRHQTPVSASFDRRRASGAYTFFSLP